MRRLKLGVHLASLGLPLRRGLAEIERLGVTGVQLDAAGDLAPRRLSQTGRRELLHLLHAHNLQVTALACPLRHGLDAAPGQQARIEYLQAALSLSYDLGARVVTVQAGRVPDDLESPPARLLTEALLALGHYGDRTGTVLAVETGLETADKLRQFLEHFDAGGLGVNFDPANLLLSGSDPYESARALQGRLTHCQGRDARRSSSSRTSQEVPLGSGDIDWLQLLAVLEEVEYGGWLTLRRETGDNRLADIAAGIKMLRLVLVGEQ
jgi:sugar phosphate isomerase/epimerase